MAFIALKEGDGANSARFDDFSLEADQFFAKFITAMQLEGSYNMEHACLNTLSTANPFSPKRCLQGSPWVTKMQAVMAGSVSLETFDNFHD